MAYTTIDDPSVYFQIGLYTGNGNNGKNINLGSPNFTGEYVGQDIHPDWIWIKNTDTNGKDHGLWDSSRGTLKQINTNNSQAENNTANSLTSFNSNGFTLGSDGGPNAADDDHVAWVWKANAGTTSSNSSGSITSTVQANTTAGFSIILYTGTGSNATIGHGLGVAPQMVIVKNRDSAESWMVGHHKNSNGFQSSVFLDLTAAKDTDSVYFNNTAPTSTLVSIGTNTKINHASEKHVMYAFAPIKGYSRFGIYRGNGSADGTFVFTGFKPAFLMFKALSGSEGWGIFDNLRTTQQGNPRDIYLQPNNNNANSSESDSVDFLSNGFKWRIDSGFRNGDGVDFIYMAFAESPFTSSEGVPTTAG
jgi:hypothetical protein